MSSPAFSYEYDPADGLWHLLMFGRRNRGFLPVASEAEARRRVAACQREADETDEADQRLSRRFRY